ncbi:MAG TPA: exodeoxyribonuclease V subunit alpha [Victivallales bacterium]|nr:exodeoxyribonuclease V subunit alpha [Victivallales bacterium]
MELNLKNISDVGIFNPIDIHFAKLMSKLSAKSNPEILELTSMLVSNITLKGRNVCVDIRKNAGKKLSDFCDDIADENKNIFHKIRLPEDPELWMKTLLEFPVVGEAESQDLRRTPLVIDRVGRLYIHRYWNYEKKLAGIIRRKAANKRIENPQALSLIMAGYSEEMKNRNQGWTADRWQSIAVFLSLRNELAIISGGPGTGKTTVLAAVLSVLAEDLSRIGKRLEAAICAPTGKAAARIQESLKQNLSLKAIKMAKDFEAKTIHRTLGYIPGSPYFKHNAENPIPADLMIVDESSMVSLPLMSKILNALRPEAKLILIGDKNQLASVESGSVFSDICSASGVNKFSRRFQEEFAKFAGESIEFEIADKNQVMLDLAVSLSKSHRFPEDKGISKMIKLLNSGKTVEAVEMLAGMNGTSKSWDDISKIALPKRKELRTVLGNIVSASPYISLHEANDVAEAYSRLNEFRVLCSNRRGPYGSEKINEIINDKIFTVITDMKSNVGLRKGTPIIVTENDYTIGLFNGDTGIIWNDYSSPKSTEGRLLAFFPKPDKEGEFFSVPLSKLPAYELAYAMTVHKAQGTGFKRVLLLLPDVHNPVLTKELIYTGISRAMEKVEIMSNDDVLSSAVSCNIERNSGLEDALR